MVANNAHCLTAFCALSNETYPIESSSPRTSAFELFLEDTSRFLCGHWYPRFGLLVMSALDSKASVNPSLTRFVTWMQWIPLVQDLLTA